MTIIPVFHPVLTALIKAAKSPINNTGLNRYGSKTLIFSGYYAPSRIHPALFYSPGIHARAGCQGDRLGVSHTKGGLPGR